MANRIPAFVSLSLVVLIPIVFAGPLSPEERPIREQLRKLRSVPDTERGDVTRRLALEIRRLPRGGNKVDLASALANLATEGDFGPQALKEVASTLSAALADEPRPDAQGAPAGPFITLAQLARYEHVPVSLDSPAYRSAIARLEADDRRRASAAIRLPDLQGKEWSLKALRGKVVLVNFWATWCPPCRKEIPDLQALYERFAGEGLIVLAISDEEAEKVGPFIAAQRVTFPVLLDHGRKVTDSFAVDGIPKSFIYDREGRLVATAIDMRTRSQFLAMLAQAGLK